MVKVTISKVIISIPDNLLNHILFRAQYTIYIIPAIVTISKVTNAKVTKQVLNLQASDNSESV